MMPARIPYSSQYVQALYFAYARQYIAYASIDHLNDFLELGQIIVSLLSHSVFVAGFELIVLSS